MGMYITAIIKYGIENPQNMCNHNNFVNNEEYILDIKHNVTSKHIVI